MKTLLLGLGNPIVSDDSVGLRVSAILKERLAGREDVEISEDYWGGLRLMERLIGYDRAIVIDAICTGAPPGTLHRLTPGNIGTQRSARRTMSTWQRPWSSAAVRAFRSRRTSV